MLLQYASICISDYAIYPSQSLTVSLQSYHQTQTRGWHSTSTAREKLVCQNIKP